MTTPTDDQLKAKVDALLNGGSVAAAVADDALPPRAPGATSTPLEWAKQQQITMQDVVSSRIAQIGYHEASETLAVRFHPTKREARGSLYQYSNFSLTEWAALRDAASVGTYFGQIQKAPGRYPYVRVDEP